MKIGAYQFAVTGSIQDNLNIMKRSIMDAVAQSVKLLVFPECALTGYPPRNIANSTVADFDEVTAALEQLQDMAVSNAIHIVVGTITKEESNYYNSAVVLTPDKKQILYHKRALWGWDKDNFCMKLSGRTFGPEQLKMFAPY